MYACRFTLVEFLADDECTHIEVESSDSLYTSTLCGLRTSACWSATYKTERGFVTCLECTSLLLACDLTLSSTSSHTSEKERQNDFYYSEERAVARRSRTTNNSKNPVESS